MLEKYKLWIKLHLKDIAIGILIVAVVATLLKDKISFDIPSFPVVTQETEERLAPKVLPTKEVEVPTPCSTKDPKIVLSNEDVSKGMNLFIADLKYYDIVETKIVTAYFTKEKLFGVNRALVPKTKGKLQSYVTIYEPLDKLVYNKEAYDTLGVNYKRVEAK